MRGWIIDELAKLTLDELALAKLALVELELVLAGLVLLPRHCTACDSKSSAHASVPEVNINVYKISYLRVFC